MPRQLEVIALGASTGGPNALARILGTLPATFKTPLLVVQHMDPAFHPGFVGWLSRRSSLPLSLAVDGERLTPGAVRVGPPGFDFTVGRDARVRLTPARKGASFAPAVDPLLTSLAAAFGRGACGVVLTGMGRDGAEGLLALRRSGGRTVAQDRRSSALFGMPRACIENGAAEVVLCVDDISRYLIDLEIGYLQPSASRNISDNLARSREAPMSKEKILIVDDSPVMLEAGRMTLEDAGYEVVTLDNPLALAAVLRKEQPVLVLCDVNMPVINGDVVAEIVARCGFAKSSIVLYSDIPVRELEAKARQCGARGFIQKTGDEEALVRAVHGFLTEAPRVQ